MTILRLLLSIGVLSVIAACASPQPFTLNPSSNDDIAKTDTVYTLADIAPHNAANDCWMAINGNVYDVTPSSSGKHPGGDAILQGCGTDATVLFETRPMGSGTPHSDKARGYLENYIIGTLNN